MIEKTENDFLAVSLKDEIDGFWRSYRETSKNDGTQQQDQQMQPRNPIGN